MRRPHPICVCAAAMFLLAGYSSVADAQDYRTGIKWQEPPVVTPGDSVGQPPSDAIILFNGKDLNNWENGENWTVEDGIFSSGKGPIKTKEKFGDCQLHIEWASPTEVKGNGQGRGNSGVFLMGIYEIQVLDSFNNPTYFDGQAGAIYKQTPPMVNAMRGPGQWNTYDILWTAPRFDENDDLKSPAYITAIHNGVVILNHFELLGDTPFHRPPEYRKHAPEGPLSLQDHGNPVRFRNVWVRPLVPPSGEQVRAPFIRNGDKETPIQK